MEGHIDSDYGKMGTGVVRYLMNPIVAVIDKALAGRQMSEFMDTTKSVPILASLKEAISKGAEVLVLGIAPSGGRIPDSWNSVIEEALENGLSIVNGLHDLLQPKWQSNIKNPERQWIWDIRVPQFIPDIATGRAANLENKRVLFVGTDMAVGKMTAGLELYSWLQKEKVNVGFVATGQIGITITGKGIPLDAFKVDHACGAVEQVVMEQADKDVRAAINGYYEYLSGSRPEGSWTRKAYLDDDANPTDEDLNGEWFDFLMKYELIWVGDADYVAEKIQKYNESIGLKHIMLLQQFPGFDYQKILKSMTLFSERVMPRFDPDGA